MNSNPPRKNPPPRWLRMVLMVLLVAVVCLAFYLNNLRVIEQLTE